MSDYVISSHSVFHTTLYIPKVRIQIRHENSRPYNYGVIVHVDLNTRWIWGPTRHETSTESSFYIGPLSSMLAQH